MQASAGEVTRLLKAWCNGDAGALEQLAPVVESELRLLARVYLRKGSIRPHAATHAALINEAYVRLIEWNAVEWQNRVHFFAVAAKRMRRVLVTQARGTGENGEARRSWSR